MTPSTPQSQDPQRWAPVWEGAVSLAYISEKVLRENGILFARIPKGGGQVQVRVPWADDERARELLRGQA